MQGTEDSARASESAGEGVVGAFFRGKDVLITGASGFVGRVLVEKLLREAPGVGTLFLLLRPKRGQAPHERVQAFTDVKLFERLRREQPHALRKLRAVEGDAALPALGLSAEDSALLRERVAVVFHAAASVRFDDPYRKAVLLNVRGTRDLCALATQMPRLEAFVHVSTAFSNSDRFFIEEKLYPPPGDWRTHIDAAEATDQRTMDILTEKLLGGHANTYVFTKALAEHVVNDYRHEIPLGIIRPSVVSGTEEDPVPGWIDNLYGPMAMIVVGLIGAVHTFLCDAKKNLNIMPVDYVARGLLLEAVFVGNNRNRSIVPVHNASAEKRNLLDLGNLTNLAIPSSSVNVVQRVYKRYFYFFQSILLYRIFFCIMDLPFSLIIDSILLCSGRKAKLLNIHRRAFIASLKTVYFSQNIFHFNNERFLALPQILNPDERRRFNISTKDVLLQPYTVFMNAIGQDVLFAKMKTDARKQEIIWEFVHFTLCGVLLLLVWKLCLPTHLVSFLLKLLRTLLCI